MTKATTMTTTVRWQDGVCFTAATGSGHTMTMDGSPEAGGRNRGARPMELVLAALGGCGSFDVVTQLRAAGQNIRAVELNLAGERADAVPGVFRRIQATFIVRGTDLDEAVVKQAVRDSATKHSSVSRMLEKAVAIEYDYRIEE